MIVEEAEAAAYNCLGSGGPGKTDAGRDVVFLVEGGIVIPAQPSIQCQRMCDFPVVLDEQSVVVVSQLDLVSLRREAADRQEEEESGIDGAELLVVGLRSEKLIILEVPFHAIHPSSFIVPPEFESMAIESLRKAGAEGTVFLLQSRGCECSAIAELALIAEYCKSTVRAEQIEERVGTGLRVCRAGGPA